MYIYIEKKKHDLHHLHDLRDLQDLTWKMYTRLCLWNIVFTTKPCHQWNLWDDHRSIEWISMAEDCWDSTYLWWMIVLKAILLMFRFGMFWILWAGYAGYDTHGNWSRFLTGNQRSYPVMGILQKSCQIRAMRCSFSSQYGTEARFNTLPGTLQEQPLFLKLYTQLTTATTSFHVCAFRDWIVSGRWNMNIYR